MDDLKKWVHKNPKATTNIGLGAVALITLPSGPIFLLIVAGVGAGYALNHNFKRTVNKVHAGLVDRVRAWSK